MPDTIPIPIKEAGATVVLTNSRPPRPSEADIVAEVYDAVMSDPEVHTAHDAAQRILDALKTADFAIVRANGALSHGTGIAALAQDLADLSRLHLDMDTAEGEADAAVNAAIEGKDTETDAYANLLRSSYLFAEMTRHSYAKMQSLEQMILDLEPTTADETLSLAVLFDTALVVFVANNCNMENNRAVPEWQKLARAAKAIIRGLVHGCGATSPILAHCTDENDLVPWAEARVTATREAAPFLVIPGGDVR